MMNSCNFTGRLTDDPKYFEGEVNRACFTLAVDRDMVKNNKGMGADYLDFIAWGDKADYIMRRFNKGDLMQVVNARAKVRLYEDSDGIKKRKTEYEIDKAYCIERIRIQDDDN